MNLSKISELLERHKEMRTSGINLIASENWLSARVRDALSCDLAGRYHSEWYGGSEHAIEIIKETEKLASKVFNVKHAIVTSLSGNMCDMAVVFAFTKPGDSVAMLHFEAGGYPLGLAKFHRKLLPVPADPKTYEVKVGEAVKVLSAETPPLVILGASYIPFPQPVKEIADAIKEKSVCVFDGSHVLGLVACSQFQDPLGEGAEIFMGSTHKSLYGPQGGIVLTNSNEHYEALKKMLDFDLDEGIGLVDNPHMNRIAALGLALEEIALDSGYGRRVIDNAKALARTLEERGVPVKFKEKGYTESHQIFLDLEEEKAQSLCHSLEKVGVFMDVAARIGVAELTHVGMNESDMDFIAEAISEVYKGNSSSDIRSRIIEFRDNFKK
jgi:glycine hydroxymethyltransferase